jgi:tetratricopeptide (TPR) repeat protein
LTGGNRAALPRQQTLRALIEWSYNLLSPHEQALLRRLSVFEGSCTLEAIEAVCAGAEIPGELLESFDILDLLSRLVDASQVEREESREQARYRFLETLKQFAMEMLEPHELSVLQRRHATFYLEFMETLQRDIEGPDAPRRQVAVARKSVERCNMRAAFAWALEHEPLQALRMAAAWITEEFWTSSVISERGEAAERALARIAETNCEAPPALTASVLGIAAEYASWRNDFQRQKRYAERRLHLMRDSNDEGQIGWALFNLGSNALNFDDYETAENYFREALSLFEQKNATQEMAWTLNSLANALLWQHKWDATRQCHEAAAELFRRNGDLDGVAGEMAQLGDLARREGDLVTARHRFAEVLRIEDELQDRHQHPIRRYQIARLEGLENDYAAARVHFREALLKFRDAEETFWILQSLAAFAWLAGLEGQWRRMATLFGAEAAWSQIHRAPPPLEWENERVQMLAAAQTALDEQTFSTAWSVGQAMTLQEAVAFALQQG